MKLDRITLSFLLILILGCQNNNDEITVFGKIIGNIPTDIEFASPINGMSSLWFRESINPDSLGNFVINIESKEAIFLKLTIDSSEIGTLIAEPGETYDVNLKSNQDAYLFSVSGKDSVINNIYNDLPHFVHIQDAAFEFEDEKIASLVKEKVEQKRMEELCKIEDLLSYRIITNEVFDLVKTDRNCHYDALLGTIAWFKLLDVISGKENEFHADFEKLWKDVFDQPLFSAPNIVNSLWINYYAENYIYFREFLNGDYTKDKIDELSSTGKVHQDHLKTAKEVLPFDIQETYTAKYLYSTSFQKHFEEELIELFSDFRLKYPNSEYSEYISTLIDEIRKFYDLSDKKFRDDINFVEDYQNINSLSEITTTLDSSLIYIDVWSTWCGACQDEFEHKNELEKLLEKNGVQILYISLDREIKSLLWENMIKYYDLEGYHLRANKKLTSELKEIYGANGMLFLPWYLLVDKEGNIVHNHVSTPSQLENLQRELNEI